MRVTVDENLCSGQGRCYAVSPQIFSPDDEGFCAQRGTTVEVAPENEAAARLAVASCPEGAITVAPEA